MIGIKPEDIKLGDHVRMTRGGYDRAPQLQGGVVVEINHSESNATEGHVRVKLDTGGVNLVAIHEFMEKTDGRHYFGGVPTWEIDKPAEEGAV